MPPPPVLLSEWHRTPRPGAPMSTWGEQLQELREIKEAEDKKPPTLGGPSPHDILRRRYLAALHEHTERAVIVYATSWMENRPVPNVEALSVNLGDKQGFMEAVSNISDKNLDLIITSPGGSPEAAEAIMGYLRTRFEHIRAVVPVAAMSAATMMALACDEILMGTHSQLGPIDPQFTIPTPEGPRSAPGQAILDQFELAKQECQDLFTILSVTPSTTRERPSSLRTITDAPTWKSLNLWGQCWWSRCQPN